MSSELMERLTKAWLARVTQTPIEPTMTFDDAGLILGAGTVLAPAETVAGQPAIRLRAGETRLSALLSAAFEKRIGPSELAHIRRAAFHWVAGDQHLAAMHLALTGLGRLVPPREAARRLFIADALLDEGLTPDALMRALYLAPDAGAAEKGYDPDQPRVPAGSGRPSGQWTSEASAPAVASPPAAAPADHPVARPAPQRAASPQARPSPSRAPRAGATATAPKQVKPATGATSQSPKGKPASITATTAIAPAAEGAVGEAVRDAARLFVGEMATETASWLAAAVPIAAPATVFFGVLLVPSNLLTAGPQDILVEGHPEMRIVGQRDTMDKALVIREADGAERRIALRATGGVYKDASGKVVGRVLPGRRAAIQIPLIAPTTLGPDEPRLCPAPSPDRYGGGPDSIGRAYEDQVKAVVNPDRPTPSGLGYALLNPLRGKDVIFDDCQHRTGLAKGPGLQRVIEQEDKYFLESLQRKALEDSGRQLAAAGARAIRWYFAEPGAAAWYRAYFAQIRGSRERIEIVVLPFDWSRKR